MYVVEFLSFNSLSNFEGDKIKRSTLFCKTLYYYGELNAAVCEDSPAQHGRRTWDDWKHRRRLQWQDLQPGRDKGSQFFPLPEKYVGTCNIKNLEKYLIAIKEKLWKLWCDEHAISVILINFSEMQETDITICSYSYRTCNAHVKHDG